MALNHQHAVHTVDCTVRVPGHAEGPLPEAAATIIERAEAVEAVAELRVTTIEPRANAVVVDADVDVEPAADADLDPPEKALADVLNDVVGVRVREIRQPV